MVSIAYAATRGNGPTSVKPTNDSKTITLFGSPICPAVQWDGIDRPHCYRHYCTPHTHPYQWQSPDVYDRAASKAGAIAYLLDGAHGPLGLAAIELIQRRQPGAFVVVPDGSWVWQYAKRPVSSLLRWYRCGGYESITDLYILTVGGRISYDTEQKIYRSRAERVYVIDPTTIEEGPRTMTVWSEYMLGKPRTMTLHSIPVVVPLTLPAGIRLATDEEVEAISFYVLFGKGPIKPAFDRGPHDDVVCTERADDRGNRGYGIRNRRTGSININMWHPIGYHWRDTLEPSTPLCPLARGKAAHHG